MFEPRIRNLRKQLAKEKLNGILISSVSNITYLSGFTNFSKDEREAYIFIGRNFAYIITDGRYTEAVKSQVPHLTIFERGYKKPAKDLFKKHKEVKQLGIEEDNLTVAEHKILSKHFKKIKHFDVDNLRSIKTKEEIGKIEKACKIGDSALKDILKKIKVGITEKEVARELENFIRDKGAVPSFPPIAAFGKNSAVPHHQTGNTVLGPVVVRHDLSSSGREGQIVLLDFGVKYDDYCSDMTRTIFFGKPTGKQKEIYKTALEAQQKAVDHINSALRLRSGSSTGSVKLLKASEVDKAARDYIVSKGYPTIPHSLGHGVGLEVHEHPSLSPKSKEGLKPGMVFSIEPGIYLAGVGGVRIEDLYVCEKNGLRQLTKASKEIIIL